MGSTPKKRILVFIDWFLPGEKAGGPIRSCVNLIEHLSDEFEFSVVTRNTDYTETIPYAHVKSDAWNVLPDGKRVYYISAKNLSRETIRKIIAGEKFDTVYLNGIWSQPFTAWPLQILRKEFPGKKAVVAVRGMLAPSAMAIKAVKKKAFLVYAKARKLFDDVVFHATSEQEANDTRNAFGKNANVKIAGNLPRKSYAAAAKKSKSGEQLKLVNVARIAPEKNTLYALEVLKEVKVPVQADFFGTVYDPDYKKQCDDVLRTLPQNVKAKIHGPVESASIPGLLSQYDLLFLPTRGENFGHIILESMQAGTPVLISDQTPWRNLSANQAGWDLSLDSPVKFATKIDELAEMNAAEYQKWSGSALDFAARYSGNEELVEKSRAIFRG